MVTLFLDTIRTLSQILWVAGRVLAAHWPQLVVLFLLGWAGRMGTLWLVTEVSDVGPTLAVLLLPFAPMCTLVSLVLMLRVMADSLPAFSDMLIGLSLRARVRDDLTVAGQVLLPFLAIYVSAGLLREDARVFLLDSFADEFLNTNAGHMDYGRADYVSGWVLLVFIVVALALRKTIALLDLTGRHLAWAGIAVYLETLWIVTLVNEVSIRFEELRTWVETRQVIHTLMDSWDQGHTWVRELSAPVTAIIDGVSAFLGSLGRSTVPSTAPGH
ncbi:MAG: hypothetical protein ACK5LN_09040 [Propioniciclava sp.]